MLSRLLNLGPRWTFVAGKGGVGKTTIAAALALELADRGEQTLVVSVDPAHSLGDALGVRLGGDPRAIPGVTHLSAVEVDPETERQRFMEENGSALRLLLERGTYLDAEDIDQGAGLTVPGMDEIAALLRLVALDRGFPGRLIVDTAPTGHTLRLLDLPQVASNWIRALAAIDAKGQAVATALTGVRLNDEASQLIASLEERVRAADRLLRDPACTRFILVTSPSEVVVAETLRYHGELQRRGIALGGIVVNRNEGTRKQPGDGRPFVHMPFMRTGPVGLDGLRRFSAAVLAGDSYGGIGLLEPEVGIQVGASVQIPVRPDLFLVSGKGGVGKSTSAAAVAIHLAEGAARKVLLLSVDPAGSLREILGMDVGVIPRSVPGVEGLSVRQLDASRAWEEFRDTFSEEVDELFARLLPAGASTALDRAVYEGLLDLAPAGLDELMALMEVVDVTEGGEYDALVVDASPTGHFLRLLEMPEIALEWCHAVLKLLLKYRDAAPIGEVGEKVLDLTRSLKALRERLRDGGATWFLAVALPEDLSVPETARLLEGANRQGIRPGALLINQALDQAGRVRPEIAEQIIRLRAVAGPLPIAAAPLLSIPPKRLGPLRDFLGAWRWLDLSELAGKVA